MKRMFWTGIGYSLGIGSWIFVQRRVKQTVERYAPAEVRSNVADRGRDVAQRSRTRATEVRDAAREGMAVMRQVERDLIEEFSTHRSEGHVGPARGLRPDGLRR